MATSQTLPPTYYLDYFLYLIDFVKQRYENFLDKPSQNFEKVFRALSRNAQLMYVRIANRTPIFFTVESLLKYKEIDSPEDAIEELCHYKLLDRVKPLSISDELTRVEALSSLTKKQLGQLAACLPGGFCQKARKVDLIKLLNQYRNNSFSDVELIWQISEREVAFWQFLFFGSLAKDNMAQFVIDALGNAKFYRWQEKDFSPVAKSAQEAQDHFAAHWHYYIFKKHLRYGSEPCKVFAWFEQLPKPLFAFAIFGKLCLRLGKWLEKNQLLQEALTVYRHTLQPPSRKQQVRILSRQGNISEALATCWHIVEHPNSVEEEIFARDFLRRHMQKDNDVRNVLTDYLLKAPTISLPQQYKTCVEQGVIEYYRARGFQAAHTENYIWRGIFGLVFWQVIYQNPLQVHHPLQRYPAELFDENFYLLRAQEIQEQLNRFEDTKDSWQYVQEIYYQYKGIANPFVGWHPNFLPLAEVYFASLQWKQIKAVLLQMARCPKENSCGFPDLTVWNEKEFFFVEIKSTTDQLSAQQYFWLEFFAQLQVPSQILRVHCTESLRLQ